MVKLQSVAFLFYGNKNIRIIKLILLVIIILVIASIFLNFFYSLPLPQKIVSIPKKIGNLKTDGILIHNIGNKVGIVIGDPLLFQKTYMPIITKYKTKGVEIFLYNDKLSPNSIDWTDASHTIVASSVKPRLQDINHYVFSLSMYKGSFLEDTSVLVGTRSNDGVTEVHMGLFPKQGANPSPMDIRELSFVISDKLIRYIVDERYWQNDDVYIAIRTVINRRTKESPEAMPIRVIINTK